MNATNLKLIVYFHDWKNRVFIYNLFIEIHDPGTFMNFFMILGPLFCGNRNEFSQYLILTIIICSVFLLFYLDDGRGWEWFYNIEYF